MFLISGLIIIIMIELWKCDIVGGLMLLCAGPEEMDEYGPRLSDSESDEEQDDADYSAVLVC